MPHTPAVSSTPTKRPPIAAKVIYKIGSFAKEEPEIKEIVQL